MSVLQWGRTTRSKLVWLLNMHAPCAHSPNGYAKKKYSTNDVSYVHTAHRVLNLRATNWRRHFQMNVWLQFGSEVMDGSGTSIVRLVYVLWIFGVTRGEYPHVYPSEHDCSYFIRLLSYLPFKYSSCCYSVLVSLLLNYMLNELVKVSAMAVLLLLLLLANFAVFFFLLSFLLFHPFTLCAMYSGDADDDGANVTRHATIINHSYKVISFIIAI